MKRDIPILVLLALAVVTPGVQAQTPDSSRVAVCATPFPIVASANTGAGFINFCVYYPESVQPGEQFSVSSLLTAPTTVVPVFLAAGSAFTPNFGCTEGTAVVGMPTTNGVVGTMWTVVSSFTLSAGSERCDFTASATLTVGAVPLQIYSGGVVLNVRTENARVDIFDYLCDAPGIAPNTFSPTSTVCNTASLNVHQDEACGAITPCLISGDLGFSGNFTQSNNVTGDFERVFVQWFPLWMGVVMIFIAIRRRESVEPNALMIGGVLFAIAAIVCPFPGHPQWLNPIGLVMRTAVVGIAIWCWLRYGTARRDWNTGEDDQ